MSKQFMGVIVIVLLIFVGIFTFNGKSSTSSSGKSGNMPTQHVEGKGSTGVTLVEYGDYQCPYCGQYFLTVKQVQAEFNDQIHFQFRNYPLTSLHPNAFAAARAAEAAALQNKFWEMHDALYETQQQWSGVSDATASFQQYAKQLGLNVTQFNQDFSSIKVNDLINADMAVGARLQISGTPTFFLDGKQVQISNTLPSFEKVIKAEIAKKQPGNNPAVSSPTSANGGTTSQTPATQ